MRIWSIKPARVEHVNFIAEHMRKADKFEVWASHRHTPEQSLKISLKSSEMAWTCFINNSPAFMWGVCRLGSILSNVGTPWLLGTPDIYKVNREFLKQSKQYIGCMYEHFERLENYVHIKNIVSIRWLKWCGFTIDKSKPIQFNNEDFYYFWGEK